MITMFDNYHLPRVKRGNGIDNEGAELQRDAMVLGREDQQIFKSTTQTDDQDEAGRIINLTAMKVLSVDMVKMAADIGKEEFETVLCSLHQLQNTHNIVS
jgi:hypothetical protein